MSSIDITATLPNANSSGEENVDVVIALQIIARTERKGLDITVQLYVF